MMGYGDYLEQLTYLLFLKMADEYSRPPHNRKMPIPTKYNWETLTNKSGDELVLLFGNHINTYELRFNSTWAKMAQVENK